jgi:CheY-like chemotaxis protein
MELHRDEFDLMTVIKFLSWGLKDLIEQKNITFNMNVDDVANKLLTTNRVVGDKQRIVQTLGNFLSNAVKFTPAGGKLELDLQCEEVVDSKDTAPAPPPNFTAYTPSDSSEGSLLGATGIQILTKTTSHAKLANQKVARLRLSVKDNGIGISAADQAKLFEPYSFVTSGWVLKAGVSGLGLSMAKRFVERAGGSIGVESMEGSGSTFFFSIPFPLVPVDLDSEREQPKVDPVAALLQKSEVTQSTSSSGVTVVHESITVSRRRSNMSSKEDLKLSVKTQPMQIPEDTHEETDVIQRKVLLVEDTRINRIILRKVLQNLNIQCDEAENGQVAVDFYKEGRTYDLVLMDKEMPVMDGHEATRQLRMMGVKTPIVALTGNALATDRQSFFEAGVDDFQTKPLSRDKLVQVLARYGVECHCRKAAE